MDLAFPYVRLALKLEALVGDKLQGWAETALLTDKTNEID